MWNYYLCFVLLIVFILLLFREIVKDIKGHIASYYIIPYCLILTLLFKYNHGVEFWGLEYEDAYSFSFCARQFSYGIYPNSFLIDAVGIGSLEDPSFIYTYGGHFITYPTFLSIFTQIFGWSTFVIDIVNTSLAFCILLILSLFGDKNKCWFIAPAIYCSAPIINVFANCFLSEIFSSFILISFAYLFIKKKNSIICLLAFSIALLCKRENLILLFIPFISSLFDYYIDRKLSIISVLKKLLPYLIFIAIYLICIQNVFEIESVESGDIGASTFSYKYFKILFPVFVKSLFSIYTFSVVVCIYIAFVLFNVLKYKQIKKEIWISTILVLGYTVLYSSHYRGYFFINGEEVTLFETYRYINNYFVFIPLAFTLFSFKKIKYTIIPAIILLSFSFLFTIDARKYFSELEYESRFKEVEVVSKYIENKDKPAVLICENILLYQNKCNSDFKVCCITVFDFLDVKNKDYDYYCILSDMEYLKERYGININMNDLKPILILPDGKYLYQYLN